jgi:hypothetical protein
MSIQNDQHGLYVNSRLWHRIRQHEHVNVHNDMTVVAQPDDDDNTGK